MKSFLKRLGIIAYLMLSILILFVSAALPFLLALDESTPIWICFVIYPLMIIVIASLQNFGEHIEKQLK